MKFEDVAKTRQVCEETHVSCGPNANISVCLVNITRDRRKVWCVAYAVLLTHPWALTSSRKTVTAQRGLPVEFLTDDYKLARAKYNQFRRKAYINAALVEKG